MSRHEAPWEWHPDRRRRGRWARGAADRVVYRRRREDWLSDSALASRSDGGAAAECARRAGIELAKAALIAKDGETGDHSDDVGLLCQAIGVEMGLDAPRLANLSAAAQLHDVGKLGVPETIINKPGPLGPEDWRVMREHTVIGERILGAVGELSEVAPVVRHSHEHWDGSGYPDGLGGTEIPLESRVVLCADAFLAIRSDRPYRHGRSAEDALSEVEANSGTQFDPAVVEALRRVVEDLHKGRERRFAAGAVGRAGQRRLAVLLLALGVAATAFAALGGGDGGSVEAVAGTDPRECEGAICSPLGPWSKAVESAEASRSVTLATSRAARAAEAERRSRAATRTAAVRRRARTERRETRPASGPAPSRTAVQAGGPHNARGRGGHAYAYGHTKRMLNPHPPKLPPGLLKTKGAP